MSPRGAKRVCVGAGAGITNTVCAITIVCAHYHATGEASLQYFTYVHYWIQCAHFGLPLAAVRDHGNVTWNGLQSHFWVIFNTDLVAV